MACENPNEFSRSFVLLQLAEDSFVLPLALLRRSFAWREPVLLQLRVKIPGMQEGTTVALRLMEAGRVEDNQLFEEFTREAAELLSFSLEDVLLAPLNQDATDATSHLLADSAARASGAEAIDWPLLQALRARRGAQFRKFLESFLFQNGRKHSKLGDFDFRPQFLDDSGWKTLLEPYLWTAAAQRGSAWCPPSTSSVTRRLCFGFMEGFPNLPDIRTTKPHLPEDYLEEESDNAPPLLPEDELTRAQGEVPELSRKFHSLMDTVLREHCKEVKDLEERVKSLQRGLIEKEGEVVHLRSQHEMLKVQDLTGKHSRTRDLSFSEIKKEQHKALKDLHASSILAVLETEDHETVQVQARFATDLDKFLRAKTEYVTSRTEDEVESLTRGQKFSLWLQSNQYETVIALVLCINVLWMALELQVSGQEAGAALGIYKNDLSSYMETWNQIFLVGDILFTTFFCLDVTLRVCVMRTVFFKVWMNYLDVAVSVTSLIEVAVFYTTTLPINPMLFRLLRIGKLVRAVRMVHMTSMLASLQLLVKCISASLNMLFWSFCLLVFFQCVAGLLISTLCRDFIRDPDQDPEIKERVFLYYGTFTRTILTMFEILFANWGPSCRILVESISEWFSLFFLVYRCVLGFAVLNVVNAVFVQQTMKTASSDEDLAFKQKEKDIAQYMRKVKRLFQTMDASGDGAINLEEFSKLVKSPKLKWLW
eukprot:symbB.v1.2.028931.t1/scaffold3114.1/size63281/2